MSMILRAAPLRVARNAAARQQVRYAHFENVVDKTIPGVTRNAARFVPKFLTYITIGFGLPFYAAHWQIEKAKGA
ncbi:hypothetical protein CcaverHIS002_0210770 [Cutaneotrichosporon cavernicola]|uniref:Cytochrome c oxidase subunit 8, mitochondrial n=1 Tax=Cutaneotrichosporon cavernicola TaxID=279322 RepID=A0AA48I9S2_9TREE|nr:uncharacterized protein CcaverHIS019_0210770 [Cutaneotrichosporon cavernicola]BEI81917.1 hypothetical protein CcaverHIS002_0210770 [Cutaneotrichosporon cavernicola]BEI89715.1 hypothetical protein CcaverHIS019_0210770 [Cutaneotrichosporon cavernicola]BEI97486.1 hypothetical protein CcaverHIS631_0210750 [Cutaneotrichosporon cavernicola]BEJ05264.1 hypothetical protein CcaverHIS641_0210810 [Cutaneotrichosporon cavernicola]